MGIHGNRKRVAVLILLTLAGLAANYLKYRLFFNVDFLFGSIFTMIVLQLFGLRWGVLSALAASSYTWLLWNHPYAIIIFTTEALVAGLLAERRRINLLLADTLFWIFAGMPMVLLFYGAVMHLDPASLAVVTLKQTLNGLLNTLIACGAVNLLGLYGKGGWSRQGVSFGDAILNVLAAFVLIPCLVIVTIESRDRLDDIDRELRTRIESVAEQSRPVLSGWLTEHMNVIKTLAVFAARDPNVQKQLEAVRSMDPHFVRIGLLNRDAVTIAFAPLTDELGNSTLGKSYADRPVIPALKQTLEPMVSEVEMSRVGRPGPRIAVLAPVIRNNRYDGFVAGIVDFDALTALLSQITAKWGVRYTLVDQKSRVIVSSRPGLATMDSVSQSGAGEARPVSGGVYQWVPPLKKNVTRMERWTSSFYMTEISFGSGIPWKLILDAPLAPLQKRLNQEYARALAAIFCLFLIAALITSLLSRRMAANFASINDFTSGLPGRISQRQEVRWPQSRFIEAGRMLADFRAMADSLSDKFDELAEMNETLERRAEERTAELRAAYSQLQGSEAKMRALFENAGDALFILEDGVKVVEANRAACEQYGYSHEELVHMTINDLNTPEQVRHIPARVEAVLQKGFAVFRTEHRTRDGRVLPIEVNCRSFTIYGKQLLISSCRDITERTRSEDALRHSRERLSLALEGSGAGLWDWQVQTGEAAFNERWAEMLGYSLKELEPVSIKTRTGLCHPDDLVRSERLLQKHLAGQTAAYECETRMRHRNGRWIWVLERGRVTERDAAGRPVRMTGTQLDITERKLAEEKVRKYSNDLEQLLAVSREMTAAVDQKLLFRAVAAASRQLLGLDYSTVMLMSDDGTRLTIVETDGFPESTIGTFTLSEGQGLATLVARAGKPDVVLDFEQETRFSVPPLVTGYGIRSAVCVPLIAQQAVLGVLIGHTRQPRTFNSDEIALYQNIANQAAVAIRNAVNLDAVRRAEKMLRDITSHIGEGLYVFDRAGRITFMNNEAERLLGWTMDEMNRTGAHELVHNRKADGSVLPFEECRMHNVTKTGVHYFSTDEVFVRKNGTAFPILVISSPIYEDGQVVAAITAFRDISDVKKLESEMLKAQKLDSIAVLAGGIAHDFNNLLQAILGNINLARMFAPPDTRYTERLLHAEQAANQAKELSYRLLTFSKGGEPVRTATDIVRPLRESAELALSGSNVIAEFDLPDGLETVWADGNQLRQVFHNLVQNAKEAMPAGGRIWVSAKNLSVSRGDGFPLREGRYVLISIRDQGRGIARKDRVRIFDPYFTTKEVGSERGRGLGLAVCHSIIMKHEGAITVESEAGTGSTFYVFLPAARGGRQVLEMPAHKPEARHTGHILLMDDEEQVQSVVSEMLRQAGYDVSVARNGEEAVGSYRRAVAEGRRYDVVILDLTIPAGMGGEAALEQIRAIDPGVSAVVSSGYADSPIMKQSRQYGFAAAIAKPFDMDQLLDVLNRLQAQKAETQEA